MVGGGCCGCAVMVFVVADVTGTAVLLWFCGGLVADFAVLMTGCGGWCSIGW